MAISPTASPVPHNHYLVDSPALKAREHDQSALMWNIATRVTTVAIFAITVAVLTVAILGSAILSSSFSWLLLGLVITSPGLGFLEHNFGQWAKQHSNEALIEHGVADELKKIAHWNQDNIRSFYQQQRLNSSLMLESLPLIARFNYWKQMADASMVEAERHLDPKAPGNYLEHQTNPAIRFQERETGWEMLENEALPARLQSAVILQMLVQPDRAIELDQIGSCRPLPLGQRLCEQILEHNDSYFEFADKRPPLVLTTVKDSSPADLRLKLFQ